MSTAVNNSPAGLLASESSNPTPETSYVDEPAVLMFSLATHSTMDSCTVADCSDTSYLSSFSIHHSQTGGKSSSLASHTRNGVSQRKKGFERLSYPCLVGPHQSKCLCCLSFAVVTEYPSSHPRRAETERSFFDSPFRLPFVSRGSSMCPRPPVRA